MMGTLGGQVSGCPLEGSFRISERLRLREWAPSAGVRSTLEVIAARTHLTRRSLLGREFLTHRKYFPLVLFIRKHGQLRGDSNYRLY